MFWGLYGSILVQFILWLMVQSSILTVIYSMMTQRYWLASRLLVVFVLLLLFIASPFPILSPYQLIFIVVLVLLLFFALFPHAKIFLNNKSTIITTTGYRIHINNISVFKMYFRLELTSLYNENRQYPRKCKIFTFKSAGISLETGKNPLTQQKQQQQIRLFMRNNQATL